MTEPELKEFQDLLVRVEAETVELFVLNRLLESEKASLRRQVQNLEKLNESLAERVAAQSELLSRRAEK